MSLDLMLFEIIMAVASVLVLICLIAAIRKRSVLGMILSVFVAAAMIIIMLRIIVIGGIL